MSCETPPDVEEFTMNPNDIESDSIGGNKIAGAPTILDEYRSFEEGADVVDEPHALEELEMRLQALETDIAIVRARVNTILIQAARVVDAKVEWVDGCAHAQMGSHPWLKLSAAAGAAFVAGRLIHPLPLGLIALAAKLLVVSAIGTAYPGKEVRL